MLTQSKYKTRQFTLALNLFISLSKFNIPHNASQKPQYDNLKHIYSNSRIYLLPRALNKKCNNESSFS